MLIDTIAAILFALALYKGFRKGLIIAIFSFFAFIIGLAAALKLSATAAEYIGSNANVSERWLPVIAFFLVFFIVVLLVRIGAKIIEGAARVATLGGLNRLGGILFYMLIYFFAFSTILFYVVQLNLLKISVTENSATYPYIQPITRYVMNVMGSVFPFLKNVFSDLLDFFGSVSDSQRA